MLTILLCFAAASILAPPLVRRFGRNVFIGLAALSGVSAGWFLYQLDPLWIWHEHSPTDRLPLITDVPWVPELGLRIVLRLDGLTSVFALLVSGMGAAVFLYCARYFTRTDAKLPGFAGKLTAFATVMLGLVLADNLLLMYTFWELTSVFSFLLVGHYAERASSRLAAGQALMVTVLGGLAMLIGIIILGNDAGTYSLSAIISHYGSLSATAAVWEAPWMNTALVLIVLGALSKSAITPFHFWLPGAMAAPTPVSAFLHSAAMVKAGIYLITVLAPVFGQAAMWHLILVPLGLFTMLLGGWMALKQTDMKLILAYGTVSQLGFLITLASIGEPDIAMAGLAMMLAHALFKAPLFMVVGIVDHHAGTRDIRKFSGLAVRFPGLATTASLAAFSMAAVPPLLGFVTKESALGTMWESDRLHGMPAYVIVIGFVAGSILTVAYTMRFMHGVFGTKPPSHTSGGGVSDVVEQMSQPSYTFLSVPAALATISLLTGVLPQFIEALIDPAVVSLYGADAHREEHLALWHGFALPLALSIVILSCGILMFRTRDQVATLILDKPAFGDANELYDTIVVWADRISLRLTAVTQRGSLPRTIGTICLVFAIVPLIALIQGSRSDLTMYAWDSPLQAALGVGVIIAALCVPVMKNRLSAVVFVGITGYGLALLFATVGAPDLALTQLLVETISLIVFVLVLRTMPANLRNLNPNDDGRRRALIAGLTGFTAVAVAAFAMAARSTVPVGSLMSDLAYDIGHGANAVNVLLVDIRAWDTLGEISVLVIVATGIASLVFRDRHYGRAPRLEDRPNPMATPKMQIPANLPQAPAVAATQDHQPRTYISWLSGNRAAPVGTRSLLLEVATRLLFPSMMIFSFYLFFAGHNSPGGGFAGGLVAGLALTLRYLAGGRFELGETIRFEAGTVLGTGLGIATLAALVPIALGDPPLTSYYMRTSLPIFGEFSLTSVLIFDLGVYLIVVGLILDILRSLGARLDQDAARRRQRRRQARHRAQQEATASPESPQEQPSASTSPSTPTARTEG